MRFLGIGLGLFFSAAGCATAWGAETVLYKAESVESILVTLDEESSAVKTQQTSVDFHKLYQMHPVEREFIAREIIKRETMDNTDGFVAEAQVDLFMRNPDGKFSEKSQRKVILPEVSEVKFNADHWTGTIFGCCDAEPYTEMFGYGDSKPFLRGNGKYAQMILPNAGLTRYVSVLLRSQTPTDDATNAVFGGKEKAVAAIMYGTPGKTIQVLYLQAKSGVKEEDVPYHTLDIDLKPKSSRDEDGYNEDTNISKVVTMWSQDTIPGQKQATSISGITIIARFSGNDGEDETVAIPVEKDVFGTPKFSGQTLQAYTAK